MYSDVVKGQKSPPQGKMNINDIQISRDAATTHKSITKHLIFFKKNPNTERFFSQMNSLKCSERRVGDQARAQASDIDDLVFGRKA